MDLEGAGLEKTGLSCSSGLRDFLPLAGPGLCDSEGRATQGALNAPGHPKTCPASLPIVTTQTFNFKFLISISLGMVGSDGV